MAKIAAAHHLACVALTCPENTAPDGDALDQALRFDNGITHVAVVHCETTTGIINPIDAYGQIVQTHGRSYLVDAMSSFGAYPVDVKASNIDFLVSSANKCIEGVPGFSFVLARREALLAARGFARTLSLDLLAQWEGLEGDGQFRFTPPTHALLAFHQALRELAEEGGVEARAARYRENCALTLAAMQTLGFKPYLHGAERGYIITAFHYPDHPRFNFREFYERLSAKGHVIYPGKLSHADCFRIGHVGRLGAADVQALMAAIAETLHAMNIVLPPLAER
jgi:2-aminoethylphosphonate-pyruvate transaminase